MEDHPLSTEELDATESRIDAILGQVATDHPVVEAVDRGEPGERRWYVRLRGEQKSVFSVWLMLGQRDLHFETYVMPAPETNHAELYEHLLRRNLDLRGLSFAIGAEDAVYLVGRVPSAGIDDAVVDRVLGSVHEAVERCFRPAMRIGFAGRFAG